MTKIKHCCLQKSQNASTLKKYALQLNDYFLNLTPFLPHAPVYHLLIGIKRGLKLEILPQYAGDRKSFFLNRKAQPV